MCVTTISRLSQYTYVYISGASDLIAFGCRRERARTLGGKMSLSASIPPSPREKLPTLYRNPAVTRCSEAYAVFPTFRSRREAVIKSGKWDAEGAGIGDGSLLALLRFR